MADVRALLKAKRSERGTITKPVKSAAAARLAKGDEEKRKGKRKLEEDIPSVPSASADHSQEKRRKVDDEGGFPADFFSDPSRAPPPASPSDDEDNDDSSSIPQPPPLTTTSSSAIDSEWEAFQRAINAVSQPPSRPTNQDAFARATIAAEPELITNLPTGFPSSVLDRNDDVEATAEEGVAPRVVPEPGLEAEPEESEGDKYKRKEREERELIMDRLLDEERAQEEADAKVSALKARLELVKKKREQVRAAKLSKSNG